jgi:2'-5' RNA ligase
MAIAVVNYPTFSQEDYDWIQSVRRRNDPLYFDIVDPHLTLVFPTEGISEGELIDHVRRHAKTFSAFKVVFRCAILGDPSFQEHAHAFLVPDEGFSGVVRLHDLLYTGPLRSELRLDIPFVPHVGIANTPTAAACKFIIDELNAQAFEIRARVETLDVIGYDGKRVWNIERLHLADSPDIN